MPLLKKPVSFADKAKNSPALTFTHAEEHQRNRLDRSASISSIDSNHLPLDIQPVAQSSRRGNHLDKYRSEGLRQSPVHNISISEVDQLSRAQEPYRGPNIEPKAVPLIPARSCLKRQEHSPGSHQYKKTVTFLTPPCSTSPLKPYSPDATRATPFDPASDFNAGFGPRKVEHRSFPREKHPFEPGRWYKYSAATTGRKLEYIHDRYLDENGKIDWNKVPVFECREEKTRKLVRMHPRVLGKNGRPEEQRIFYFANREKALRRAGLVDITLRLEDTRLDG